VIFSKTRTPILLQHVEKYLGVWGLDDVRPDAAVGLADRAESLPQIVDVGLGRFGRLLGPDVLDVAGQQVEQGRAGGQRVVQAPELC